MATIALSEQLTDAGSMTVQTDRETGTARELDRLTMLILIHDIVQACDYYYIIWLMGQSNIRNFFAAWE